jgi:hypothetical protein
MQAHLVLVRHLDRQVLEEPRVVLDLLDRYSLHEMAGENAENMCHFVWMCSCFGEKYYLLRVCHENPGQQMSALY